MIDLSERDQREILTKINEMGGLDAVTGLKQTTRKVGPDEEWGKHAVAAYQAALKYPETGFIQKHDARIIKGLLDQISDAGIVREFKEVRAFHGAPANALRPVLASLMWQIIVQRGLELLATA